MNKKNYPYIAMCLTLILWATSFIGIRYAIVDYSPFNLALLRYLTASVVAIGYLCYLKKPIPCIKDLVAFFLLGGAGITLYNFGLNYGSQTANAGTASFIVSQTPIFTTILAALFINEKISKKMVFGMAVSFIGVVIISTTKGDIFKLELGAIAILIAALSQSIYFVFQKPLLKKYKPTEVIAYSILGGTIPMLAFFPGLLADMSEASKWSTATVIYLGIFPAVFAYYFWSYALANLPVSIVSNSLYALPVITTAMGVVFLNEIPTLKFLVGACIALLGILIIHIKKKKLTSL